MAEGKVIYSLRAVDKSFESRAVLKNFNLDVPHGSVVAILGPSGCGKTTLLRICAGLDYPDKGSQSFPLDVPQAWVFQETRLLPWLKVKENILHTLHPLPEQANSVVEGFLKLMGLGGLGDHYPDELSGGMARRVALARALAKEAQITYMDEPFVGLNKGLKAEIASKTIAYLKSRSRTSLWVTHDQDLAQEHADLCVYLDDLSAWSWPQDP
jgi:ABC-type nitrate/sulfonate/bicarbonate transport system ATPase subunit